MPTLNFNNSTDYMESSEHLMDAVNMIQAIESQLETFETKIKDAKSDDMKKSALFEISMALPQLKSIAKVAGQNVADESRRLDHDFEVRSDAETKEMADEGEL